MVVYIIILTECVNVCLDYFLEVFNKLRKEIRLNIKKHKKLLSFNLDMK